jgi:hypothetical protein
MADCFYSTVLPYCIFFLKYSSILIAATGRGTNASVRPNIPALTHYPHNPGSFKYNSIKAHLALQGSNLWLFKDPYIINHSKA